MAIQRYAGDRYTGTSTDAKPSNVANGAVFYETDTLKEYLRVSGLWQLMLGQITNVDGGYSGSIYGGTTSLDAGASV